MITNLTALVTKLTNELEVASRREHRNATGNEPFDTCGSTLCTMRRALLDEAREAVAGRLEPL